MHRVLITDSLAEEGLALFRATDSIELEVASKLSGPPLRAALGRADGVIIRSGTQLTAEVLEGQKRLKAIVRAGVGVDNIDVKAATREGIVVMNTPGGNTVSTAEHTIALLMALCRNVPQATASLRAGKWERNTFTGSQLGGKTLGVIGLGRVGMAVARRALGLEMKVLGYDPFLSAERAAEQGIESAADVAEVLRRCDVLTVHTPLTEDTKSLIGRAELAAMKRGARIVNCARGGIVDEAALEEALVSGQVAGAALDVFVSEPPGEHPLLKLPNVIATPHLGASTAEAQTSVAIEAARLMIDFLDSGRVSFAVNMAAVDRTELDELGHFIDLARRLGLLHAQMDRGKVQRAEIQYTGDLSQKKTRLLTAAFAAGMLETALEEQVNLVNAEILARERGIEIVERTSNAAGDFGTLVHTEVQTDRKRYVAAATLFGNQYIRLVRLGPYHLDSFLDGILLIFTHRDVPGLIGFIGTVFGRHEVNIAQMNVGRKEAGGDAIAVLNLDSEPPAEALAEIRNHPHISSVSIVKLPPRGETPPWMRS